MVEQISSFICRNCGTENKCKRNTTNTYCNNKCQQQYQRNASIQKWVSGDNISADRRTLRGYTTHTVGYFCNICNIDNWNDKEITLQVDHIDGDASNNRYNNVRLLCPNCHSQQPTWGARNKGNGRAARGLPLR